jgi:hypothetical protein
MTWLDARPVPHNSQRPALTRWRYEMTFSEGTPSGSRGSLDPPREGVDWVGGRAHTPQPGTTLTLPQLQLLTTLSIPAQGRPLRRRKLDIHYSIPKDNPSDKDVNQGTVRRHASVQRGHPRMSRACVQSAASHMDAPRGLSASGTTAAARAAHVANLPPSLPPSTHISVSRQPTSPPFPTHAPGSLSSSSSPRTRGVERSRCANATGPSRPACVGHPRPLQASRWHPSVNVNA